MQPCTGSVLHDFLFRTFQTSSTWFMVAAAIHFHMASIPLGEIYKHVATSASLQQNAINSNWPATSYHSYSKWKLIRSQSVVVKWFFVAPGSSQTIAQKTHHSVERTKIHDSNLISKTKRKRLHAAVYRNFVNLQHLASTSPFAACTLLSSSSV